MGTSPFDLFFTFSLLAVSLKALMLEYLYFSHTTGSMHYDGCAVKCFVPIGVRHVQTQIL